MSNDVSSIHLDSMNYALIGLQAQNKVSVFLKTFYFDCIHSLSLMDLLARFDRYITYNFRLGNPQES